MPISDWSSDVCSSDLPPNNRSPRSAQARGERQMRTDFETLQDGEKITLHPLPDNPIHKEPVRVIVANGYFYAMDANGEDGPDYYMGDVLRFNQGFTQ